MPWNSILLTSLIRKPEVKTGSYSSGGGGGGSSQTWDQFNSGIGIGNAYLKKMELEMLNLELDLVCYTKLFTI